MAIDEPALESRGVQPSVTVSTTPQHGETAAKLLAAADGALYEAKQNGRTRVEPVGSSD